MGQGHSNSENENEKSSASHFEIPIDPEEARKHSYLNRHFSKILVRKKTTHVADDIRESSSSYLPFTTKGRKGTKQKADDRRQAKTVEMTKRMILEREATIPDSELPDLEAKDRGTKQKADDRRQTKRMMLQRQATIPASELPDVEAKDTTLPQISHDTGHTSTLNQKRGPTSIEFGGGPSKEVGGKALKELGGRPTSKELGGRFTSKELGRPTLKELGVPPLNELGGRPTSKELGGRPTSKELRGRHTSKQGGRPPLKELGKNRSKNCNQPFALSSSSQSFKSPSIGNQCQSSVHSHGQSSSNHLTPHQYLNQSQNNRSLSKLQLALKKLSSTKLPPGNRSSSNLSESGYPLSKPTDHSLSAMSLAVKKSTSNLSQHSRSEMDLPVDKTRSQRSVTNMLNVHQNVKKQSTVSGSKTPSRSPSSQWKSSKSRLTAFRMPSSTSAHQSASRMAPSPSPSTRSAHKGSSQQWRSSTKKLSNIHLATRSPSRTPSVISAQSPSGLSMAIPSRSPSGRWQSSISRLSANRSPSNRSIMDLVSSAQPSRSQSEVSLMDLVSSAQPSRSQSKVSLRDKLSNISLRSPSSQSLYNQDVFRRSTQDLLAVHRAKQKLKGKGKGKGSKSSKNIRWPSTPSLLVLKGSPSNRSLHRSPSVSPSQSAASRTSGADSSSSSTTSFMAFLERHPRYQRLFNDVGELVDGQLPSGFDERFRPDLRPNSSHLYTFRSKETECTIRIAPKSEVTESVVISADDGPYIIDENGRKTRFHDCVEKEKPSTSKKWFFQR